MFKAFLIALLLLMPVSADAASAWPSPNNQNTQPIACVDASNANEMVGVNCDSNGKLLVNATIGGATTVANGVVDIPNDGATDRTQMPSLAASNCTLQAPTSNADLIYVGGSTVTNSSGTNEGLHMTPGTSIASISVTNLDILYVAADSAGDDVKYLCN
ncbi:MAG: hypothetical protein GWN93_27015 [Deltaproteobacteria bacterium]|nr:hypothetical protein [Deltaproteobacteria bacterium]